MKKTARTKPTGLLVAAMICFAIAAVAFTGLILRSDSAGRAIFGAAWGTLGLVWFIKYLTGRETISAPGAAGTETADGESSEDERTTR